MTINGQHYRTIWLEQPGVVQIIDQRGLPHQLEFESLRTLEEAATAIREMHVRGAPLIGSTAAYGMYLALYEARADRMLSVEECAQRAADTLGTTRPTAVNLAHALRNVLASLEGVSSLVAASEQALATAERITKKSIDDCRRIGEHGLPLLRAIHERTQSTVNVLTHCNAGWLACIDYGTATAPIYAAHRAGIPVHVWVDETRPRNQGARITAYELGQQGVPHTVIPDNTGGHLMQHDRVDMVIVGADRVTRQGDAANKIGTYLKALAAADNQVPFYVALPSSTLDWKLTDGVAEIPIEQRSPDEVRYIQGWSEGQLRRVLLTPPGSPAVNYGFDVTPARLITGLIMEEGVCAASEEGIREMLNSAT